MCARCEEIDREKERYKWIASRMTDERTLKAIKELLEQYDREKQSLHPDNNA